MEKIPGFKYIGEVEQGAKLATYEDQLIVCPPDQPPYVLRIDGTKEPVVFVGWVDPAPRKRPTIAKMTFTCGEISFEKVARPDIDLGTWTQDQDPNSFDPIHNAIRKTK